MSYVMDHYGVRRCEECGYEPEDGHNPEIHAAEMRAAEYAFYEPPEYDYDDRDYDGPTDAQCVRCGIWDDGMDDRLVDGEYVPVCDDCVTAAERLDDQIRWEMSDHELGLHQHYSEPTCLYCLG
jgi:hypothetical protein